MSDLVEKVADALMDAEGNIMDESRAAISVILKELSSLPIDEASWLVIVRWASENGVRIDE